MNGFANAILSLLLGWLRSLFNAVWALLGSERSGFLIDLLRDHWKLIFLVMCVGGFVIDRVIYLIRWRPYQVWRAKREHRRQQREGYYDTGDYARSQGAYPVATQRNAAYDEYDQDHYADEGDYNQPEFTPTYQPPIQNQRSSYPPPGAYAPPGDFERAPYAPAAQGGYAPAQPASMPDRRPATREPAYQQSSFRRGDTTVFSPDASFAPTVSYGKIPYTPPVEPEPIPDELRFDDDPAAWNAPQSAFEDFAPRFSPDYNPAAGMKPVFGATQPEPVHYLQDVQSSYAPQPMPEQRYARPEPAAEPVHPGLDIETFQQNIGLTNPAALDDSAHRDPTDNYPNFTPFPVASQPETPDSKPRGLGALAKKARSFVSGDDERNPRSIRDLQPTVDVKSAFHAPVYPKKKSESEEE